MAHEMFEGILAAVYVSPGTVGRGRESYKDALSRLLSQGAGAGSFKMGTVAAKNVDPDRVAMPKSAGVLDPCANSSPDEADAVCNLPRTVLPVSSQPSVVPRPCHMVTPDNHKKLIKTFFEANMIVLLKKKTFPLIPRVGRSWRARFVSPIGWTGTV